MIKRLIAIRLMSLFSTKGKKKTSGGRKVGFAFLSAFLIVYFFAAFGFMFYSLSPVLMFRETAYIYYSLAATMSIIFTLIGSVFIVQSQIFDAKDNELLLSMPIKPRDIVISRLASVLIINLGYSMSVMIPAYVICCIVGEATLLGSVSFILGSILLPVFSLALGSFIAFIIALITSRMKRKNVASTIIAFAAFGAYLYFCSSLGSFMANITEKATSLGNTLASFANPAKFFAYSVASPNGTGDMILNLIYTFLSAGLLLAVSLLLLGKFFSGIATAKKSVRVKYVRRELKTSSVRVSILKKELRKLLTTPAYLLNCGLGTVFIVVLGVAVILKAPDIKAEFSATPFANLVPIVICLIIGVLLSMTDMTAASISLEAKTLWILRSSPIKTSDIFFGKAATCFVFAIVPTVFCSLSSAIAFEMSLFDTLAVILINLTVLYFFSVFGLYINIIFPKFDWLNETVAIKQSMSIIISMFGGFAIIGIPAAVIFLTDASLLSSEMQLTGLFLFFAILSALFTLLLFTRGKKRFEKLECL